MFIRTPKRLLVTGGSGFIGSAFIRMVLPRVDKIVNIDLLTYAADERSLLSIENDPHYTFVHGNICDGALLYDLCKAHDIDTIVHCAAESHVDRSIETPEIFLETNVRGTFTLLEVVRKLPHIHFHHVSTDEVYGTISEGYFNEKSPYGPNTPYSGAKAASDQFVRAWTHTYDISTTMSHCTNNFGPYQHPEKLIPRMVLFCMQKKPLTIHGKGDHVRDWLYVDDHAEALWTILQKGKAGEVYDISARCEKKNIDIINEISQILSHLNPRTEFADLRPKDDFRYAIDPTKIETELGWHPTHPFSEAFQETVLWFYENFQEMEEKAGIALSVSGNVK